LVLFIYRFYRIKLIMAATRMAEALDFGKTSELINVKLQEVQSLPSPWRGGLVDYNGVVYYSDGVKWYPWADVESLIQDIQGDDAIEVTISDGTATVKLIPDNSTIEIATIEGKKRARVKASGITSNEIKDSEVVTAKIKDLNVTTAKIAAKAITFAKIQDVSSMIVVGNLKGSSGSLEEITVITNLDAIITLHNSLVSAKAVKEYVDGLVGGLGELMGEFDPTTGSFPSNSKKADYWYVNKVGTVHGVKLQIGDVLIAKKDSASTTDPDDWIFLEVNRDEATTEELGTVKLATEAEAKAMSDEKKVLTPKSLSYVAATNAETQGDSETKKFVTPSSLASRTATEARSGMSKIATSQQVAAGEDDSTIVTPAKLHVHTVGMLVAASYVANIGNGLATSISVTHNFGTRNVIPVLWDNATHEKVHCGVAATTVDKVTYSFSSPPANNEFRATITKVFTA